MELKLDGAFAEKLTNIIISGSICVCVNESIQIVSLGHVDTVIYLIDVSDLRIINSTGNGIDILPDVAVTISNMANPVYPIFLLLSDATNRAVTQ